MSDSVAAMAPAQSQPQPQPQPEPEPAAELEPPAEALALGTHQTEITAERSAVSEQTQPIQPQPGAPRQEHPPSQPPYGAPYGHRHQPQMADPSYAPYSMPHQQQQFDHYAPHPTRNDMSSRPPHRETHRRGGGPAESFKIFIAGLPTHTEEADLTDCFGQIGNVVGVDLKKGYGFVRFSDMASAQEAVAKYDQGSFLGATIKVEMSHNQGPTRNSKITCFNCGAEGHYARTCPMPEDLDGQRARAHQVAERTKANKAAAAAGLPPPERGPDLGPPPMSSAMPLPPPANGDPYAAPYNDRTAPYMPPADPYYGGAGGRDFYGGPDRMGGPPPPGPPPPAAAAAGGAPYMPPYLRDSDGGRGAPPPPSSAPYEYRAHPSSANNYGYSPPAPDRYGGGGGNAAPYGRDYYPPPPVDPYYGDYRGYQPPPMGYSGYGTDPYYGAAAPRGRSPPPGTGPPGAPIGDDRRGGYTPMAGGNRAGGRRRSLSPQSRTSNYSDNQSRRMDRF